MSSIPSNINRVPNMLSSAISYGSIRRSSIDLLRIQQQIVSGREISRASDDVMRASLISVLDERLERGSQISRNLDHADSALGVLDSLFQEAHTLGLSAKSIASEQLTASSSAEERRAQAGAVDQLILSLFNTANRQSVAGFALAGGNTGSPAVQNLLEGYRSMGSLRGLTSDLGISTPVPITFGANNPIAGLSARVRGQTDFNPALTPDTALSDLNGARGLGVTLGGIRFIASGGPLGEVNLADADTVGDVATLLESAIRDYEAEFSLTVLGPGGVTVSNDALAFDIAPGSTLEFSEIGTAPVARDLGLTTDAGIVFSSSAPDAQPLSPNVTWRTPVSALQGLAAGGPLGSISLSNAGRTAEIDLSSAQTLGDIRNRIEAAGLGVRVLLNADGSGIDALSDTSAGSANALSITDTAGGSLTATRLGLRTMTASTRIEDFNFGRGVGIIDARTDPQSGLYTPALNADIRVILGDNPPTTLDIDLRPQDMTTVASVIARINEEASDQLLAAGLSPTMLVAELDETSNGIVLRQDAAFADAIRIEPRNNSNAAQALGLMDGTYVPGRASLVGEDRAKVRVDGLFSDLIDLREALRANDVSGISLAGENLERSINGVVDARGLVGGFARRVDQEAVREAERATTDEVARSNLRDTDITRAASRMALLQTQLQAGLQVAATSQRMTILDFLG